MYSNMSRVRVAHLFFSFLDSGINSSCLSPIFRLIFLLLLKQTCDDNTAVNSPLFRVNTCTQIVDSNSHCNPSRKEAGKEKGSLLGPPVAGAEHPVGVDELQPFFLHELGGLEAAPLLELLAADLALVQGQAGGLAEEEEEVAVGCRTGLAVSRP